MAGQDTAGSDVVRTTQAAAHRLDTQLSGIQTPLFRCGRNAIETPKIARNSASLLGWRTFCYGRVSRFAALALEGSAAMREEDSIDPSSVTEPESAPDQAASAAP